MKRGIAFAAALALVAVLPSLARAVDVEKSAKGMTYALRVPAGWDAAKGGRLVLALHGQGGSHDQMMRACQAAPYLNDAVICAPDATSNAAWEMGDLDLLADLIREVKARVRSTRTIAFGFSRGGYCSFGLGLMHPEVVDACIPHSGGLLPMIPTDGAKKQIYYVIHGDADPVVNVTESREAVKRLEAAGVKAIKYDEVPGLGHTIEPAAVKRAFDWVEATLGPLAGPLSEADAKAGLAALEKAVTAKDGEAACAALGGLARASKPSQARAAKAAKKGLDGKDDACAIGCAEGLGDMGGDAATATLIGALAPAETAKRDTVVDAIQTALQKITGKTFPTSKEWKKWAAGKA